ncbi:MAG: MotA/TolQ/ExbB proton channel family protein [Parachlamydiaceae bacterium]
MIVNIILASNPFIDAYIASDWMGKLIFIGLIMLSIISWILIAHKGWITYLARKNSMQFYKAFESQRTNPLGIESTSSSRHNRPNPFFNLYFALKKYTLEILNKNRHFGQQQGATTDGLISYMSPTDVDFVQSHLMVAMTKQVKYLEKNLFILATIVSLAPFLGLLGTVWGILTTFSELQTQTGGTHNVVLGGISLALATTVLGLVDAIPALIGYNYLKNSVRDFQVEMEEFSNELLASVEIYYRKVDVS